MQPVARLLVAVFASFSLVFSGEVALAQTSDDADLAAATAYREALASYGAGDLQGALDRMRESYRLSQRSELLYNIARLEAELGDCAASLSNYREYVRQVPEGQYRAAADQASRELEGRCPDVAPASPPTNPPPANQGAPVVAPPPTTSAAPVRPPIGAVEQPKQTPKESPHSYWTPPRLIGWSLVAGGTAAGLGALYFTVAAVGTHDTLQDQVIAQYRGGPEADLTLQGRQHREQGWAQALAVTSGALLVGGILVLVLSPGPQTASLRTASLSLEPGLLGARLSGSF